MATLDQLEFALVNADKAGDTEAARTLAAEITKMRQPEQPSTLDSIKQGAGNLAAGALRGAGSIGATLLTPVDAAARAMGVRNDFIGRTDRREQMDAGLQSLGADPSSMLFKTGKLGGEIAGTAGAGGVLANGARALGATRALSGLEPIVNGVARGLETGGFRVGELAGTGAGALARVGTGGAVGASAAGLVNPEDAGTGALIGGALPGAAQLAGKAGAGIRNAVTGGGVAPEVAALAKRAQELGINIPADRLVNSRPMNAAAASLNYVPLSGRAATEDAMASQLNRRLSNTFGQDSSNVTMALRKADGVLGGQFETTLKNNGVAFGPKSLAQLSEVFDTAQKELGDDALKPIVAQVNDLLKKGFGDAYKPAVHGHGGPSAGEVFGQLQNIIESGATGAVDGQAAYNIKRALDRIGRGNTPTSFHALELKGALMDALNGSLGPQKAAEFATTRAQYGNMLKLEKLAKNGAEGEISVARLANMQGINNPQMQELADIAAQFVKPREGAHGAAQRVSLGGMTAALGGWVGGPVGAALAAGTLMGGGRAANGLLNSKMIKNYVAGGGLLGEPETLGLLTQGAYRALPLLPAQ